MTIALTHFFSVETWIDRFLSFYRDAFPHASITPKLHMMEDHVVPFLKKWKVGFGFLGEQAIHARFNFIRRNYSNMPNSVARLEAIMKEHLSQVCPTNIAKLPAPRPRKRKNPVASLYIILFVCIIITVLSFLSIIPTKKLSY